MTRLAALAVGFFAYYLLRWVDGGGWVVDLCILLIPYFAIFPFLKNLPIYDL